MCFRCVLLSRSVCEVRVRSLSQTSIHGRSATVQFVWVSCVVRIQHGDAADSFSTSTSKLTDFYKLISVYWRVIQVVRLITFIFLIIFFFFFIFTHRQVHTALESIEQRTYCDVFEGITCCCCVAARRSNPPDDNYVQSTSRMALSLHLG